MAVDNHPARPAGGHGGRRVTLIPAGVGVLRPSIAAQGGAPTPRPPTPQQADFVERRIRPVLAENCVRCHGPRKRMGGLRLDSRAALLAGGDNGPVVKPGDPAHSSLISAVNHDGSLKMPPRGKLKPEAIAALSAWVKMGAPWPATTAGKQPDPDGAAVKHWAFRPVRDPPLPGVRHAGWPRTSVDYFILAGLEGRG